MGISERDRVRYARQLLLPQIGEAGQVQLLAHTLRAPAAADPDALEVARIYLERAGLRVVVDDHAEAQIDAAREDREPAARPLETSPPEVLRVASPAEIERLAGRPELLPAARALAGALAAVAAIRRTLGGSAAAATAPAVLSISSEDA